MKTTHRNALLAATSACCAVTFSLQGTQAAFTATTSSVGTFSAGTVALSDDDAGAALFTASGLKPGDTATRCIEVAYTGSLGSQVRLWTGLTEVDSAAADGAELAANLDVLVEYDTVTTGAFAGCGDFASEGTLYTGTLEAMATAHTDFSTGRALGTAGGAEWTPATNETRVFRITYQLNSAAPNTAQGDSASATFTWEAQNT